MPYECKLIKCYPGAGPERVIDGNMENAPLTNWLAVTASRAVVTDPKHGGCQSIWVQATADNGYIYQNVTVEAGHKYKIGAWGVSSAAGHRWRLRFYIAGTVRWTGSWHDNTTWEEWPEFYRIPNGVTTLQIRLEIETSGEMVYFDDVTVKREAPVPMTEIDLQYNPRGGYSLLNQGIRPGRPERVSLYGGRLELELVRQEDGKRSIPLKLIVEGTDGQNLIDRVNALEEMLRHAARYRKDEWGGEVFLSFKIDDATHGVWFPVCEGEIDTDMLYEKCGGEQEDMIRDLPVWVTCEPYWESPFTYDLSNLLDNPGFEEWNSGICNSQPDGWTNVHSVAVGTATNNQETDTVEEGCKALQIKVAGINNANWKGVNQDITARLRADTEYTLLAWVQNTVITNGSLVIEASAIAIGTIGTALNSGAAHTDYTLVSCQFTPTTVHIAAGVIIAVYIYANANGCTGIVHIDKMLVMKASNVPTGWLSSSYLMNHYDRTAGHINYVKACDIPGEVDAESRFQIQLNNDTTTLYLAKRTRDDPCKFIWQLLGVNAIAGTDAALVGGDGTVPGGTRIDVSFATVQTMAQRCYWDITSNLASYYGKFMLGVLCQVTATTDVVNMKIRARDEDVNTQAYVIKQEVPTAADDWALLTGWEILTFRIGTSDNDLFGVGNNWRIEVCAEIIGAAPWDTLKIAGVYLISLDEAYLIGSGALLAGGTWSMILKDMDGDRGLFGYGSASDTYLPNLGTVGVHPRITPKIENWLYFILAEIQSREVDIADSFRVSLTYRPRGIFLRGTNP